MNEEEFGPHKGPKRMFKTFVGDDNCNFQFGPAMAHKMKMKKGFGPAFAFMAGNDCCGPNIKGLHTIKQVEQNGILHVLLHVPGLDKTSIKLRAKADKITFSGTLKPELVELLGESNVKLNVTLNVIVDATKADAHYSDGVMWIKLPIIEEGEEINIE